LAGGSGLVAALARALCLKPETTRRYYMRATAVAALALVLLAVLPARALQRTVLIEEWVGTD
jgi:hypothetical protein